MRIFDPDVLFDLEQTIARELFEGKEYPWEVLPEIPQFLLKLAERLPKDFERVAEFVWVGKGTKIEGSALVKGPAIIGRDCEIRHCAFLRENVIIGDETVVGNSTEIKNAVLFNHVQVPHYNYVGDSVLGYRAHLGAGSIISNLKSIGGTVSVKLPDGSILDTKLRKFGALVGKNAEVGCNCVLNPGTIVGEGSVVYPLTPVRGYIPPRHILKNNGELVKMR